LRTNGATFESANLSTVHNSKFTTITTTVIKTIYAAIKAAYGTTIWVTIRTAFYDTNDTTNSVSDMATHCPANFVSI
jgi:hypothetical protein